MEILDKLVDLSWDTGEREGGERGEGEGERERGRRDAEGSGYTAH